MLFLNDTLTFLLILLIILIIFCFMHSVMYKSQVLRFDYEENGEDRYTGNGVNGVNGVNNAYDKYDSNINRNKINYQIMHLHRLIDESKNKLKENFESDMTEDEAQELLQKLIETIAFLDNINTVELPIILEKINEINQQRIANKQAILQTLTSIYIYRYIQTINEGNAAANKEYLKYQNPKENKYYKQYL